MKTDATQLLQNLTAQELIERAEFRLQRLIDTGGKAFIMCVPPEPTDDDLVFAELIRRFSNATEDLNTYFGSHNH